MCLLGSGTATLSAGAQESVGLPRASWRRLCARSGRFSAEFSENCLSLLGHAIVDNVSPRRWSGVCPGGSGRGSLATWNRPTDRAAASAVINCLLPTAYCPPASACAKRILQLLHGQRGCKTVSRTPRKPVSPTNNSEAVHAKRRVRCAIARPPRSANPERTSPQARSSPGEFCTLGAVPPLACKTPALPRERGLHQAGCSWNTSILTIGITSIIDAGAVKGLSVWLKADG